VDAPESPPLPFARKPETRSRDALGGS